MSKNAHQTRSNVMVVTTNKKERKKEREREREREKQTEREEERECSKRVWKLEG